jgi:hypothetical protein
MMKMEVLGQVIHHSLFRQSPRLSMFRNATRLFYMAIEACELSDAARFLQVFDGMVGIFAGFKLPAELQQQGAAAIDGLRHTRESIVTGNSKDCRPTCRPA